MSIKAGHLTLVCVSYQLIRYVKPYERGNTCIRQLGNKCDDDLLRYGHIDCMSFVCLFLLSLYFFI